MTSPTVPNRATRPRRRRWIAVLVGLLLALGATYAAAHLLTDRYAWARAVAWWESDIGDQHRFPQRSIPRAGPVSLLPPGASPTSVASRLSGSERSLEAFLARTDTRALVVVQGDRLVYEHYRAGAGPQTPETSFSMAKSVLSILVGIASDEGLLDVAAPITDYLPELAERDSRFAQITVRNLLTMSSGISYEETGLPWSDDALTYYGTDLRELALQRTQIDSGPNQTWLYNNFHPLLLGLILERVTDMTVSDWMASMLWGPLGAEADASWSLDSTDSGFEKMESGVNAVPRDFARLGLLMLHGGRWNDRRIVSRGWVAESTAASTETDPADFYQYLWWVSPVEGTATAPFFARGKYGQTIGVFPAHDVVMVRLGSSEGDVDWPAWMAERVAEISQ